MSRDYSSSQGGAAIGARLRRLSDRIDREASSVYAELGVAFEQRWYGVLNQLVLSGPMTVGQIADRLGVTHAAVSQVCSSLKARGLIETQEDPEDARRNVIVLSRAGKRIVAKLTPIWNALNETALELDRDAGQVVRSLDRLEAALDKQSLISRVLAKL